MICSDGLAQTGHEFSVIIADQEYSDIWQKVLKKLDGFPIAETDNIKGLIKSGKITFKLSGIMGVKYLEENQEFKIQIKEQIQGITSITVIIRISRLLRNGKRIDITDTSDYERTLLDYITIYDDKKLTPFNFR
jgi:hypothetical protein